MTDWNEQLDKVEEADYEVEDLVDWLSKQTANSFATSLVSFYEERDYLTPSQLDAARRMRAEADDPVTQEGMYLNPDGDTVRVRQAHKGHFYAVNLDGELIKGGIRGLRGSMRMEDEF